MHEIGVVTIAECARHFRVPVKAVLQLIENGELAQVSVAGELRIARSERDAYVERNRVVVSHARLRLVGG